MAALAQSQNWFFHSFLLSFYLSSQVWKTNIVSFENRIRPLLLQKAGLTYHPRSSPCHPIVPSMFRTDCTWDLGICWWLDGLSQKAVSQSCPTLLCSFGLDTTLYHNPSKANPTAKMFGNRLDLLTVWQAGWKENSCTSHSDSQQTTSLPKLVSVRGQPPHLSSSTPLTL